MLIEEVINNSFFLNISQKIYLIEKVKNSDEIYKNKLLNSLKSEKVFIIQLLKKYKQDSSNTSIWQLKWELMSKNFEKIRNLEKSDNNDFFDVDTELELN